MSMNQYMHPRNIYKQPPNFKQLAIDFPEFRKYSTQDISGKVTIDFKNVEALRVLTCTLLKKDFGLSVEIPANKLIPTVPLRLNYILWIEDLLNLADRFHNIKGIDIGTGASCVYPLLGAKKNNWSMVATEIDDESIKYARENVIRNNLESLITVVKVSKDSLLSGVEGDFDFCMCNPPFFSNVQELQPGFKARKLDRPRPKNAFCASVDEVVAKGGEVDYISKLIKESHVLGARIKIYSTMIGHKSSLPPLKKQLRDVGVVSFKQTEFCQGHTTRWGLAWTFIDIDLTKIPDSLIAAKQKLSKPLVYEIPKLDDSRYKISFVCERLIKIFQELEIEFQEIKHIKNLIEYVITAYSNTWSHQRRKKREKLRLSDEIKNENNNEKNEVLETCEKLAEFSVRSPSNKRPHEDDCGFYNAKKIKTDTDLEKVFLKAKISVMKIEDCIGLELLYFDGSGTKEALHQVLQYIKNNLVKEEL